MAGSDWDRSAEAWIASIGEAGDWTRRNVLDPAMLARVDAGSFRKALDVGCGEGRFCRMLAARGVAITGIDPTERLIDEARRRDPAGDYRIGRAEELPVPDGTFDLVVSYLSLIDIPDFRGGIAEMARVLAPGGTLLIGNLNSFVTVPSARNGSDRWHRAEDGAKLHFRFDHYLQEVANHESWDGIEVTNYHRPLSAYMQALLGQGLKLVHFDEPDAIGGSDEERVNYRRVPYALVMEWKKP